MDLESILSVGLSKKQNEELDEWVGNSQTRFDNLMHYFLHDEFRFCQRASWTFGRVCQQRSHLMIKWMPQILNALETPKHDAVIRNTVRAFQYLQPIPEEYEGEIYDKCFGYLLDLKSPIAVKAFSMTVCRRIALKYPDLKSELINVIEELIINGSAGIVSRGKKELLLIRNS